MRGVFSLILVQPANVRGSWTVGAHMFPLSLSLPYVFVHPLVCVVRWFGEKTKKRKERKEKKREGGKKKRKGGRKNANVNTFFFLFRVTVLFFAFFWVFFLHGPPETASHNCTLPTAVPPIINFLTDDV